VLQIGRRGVYTALPGDFGRRRGDIFSRLWLYSLIYYSGVSFHFWSTTLSNWGGRGRKREEEGGRGRKEGGKRALGAPEWPRGWAEVRADSGISNPKISPFHPIYPPFITLSNFPNPDF
jgi:hypothetical protein